MTTIGSVKPFSQPPTPLRLMEQPQQIKLVINAQVTVVDRSAVDERKHILWANNKGEAILC